MLLKLEECCYSQYSLFHRQVLLEPYKPDCLDKLLYFNKKKNTGISTHETLILYELNPILQFIDDNGLDKSMCDLVLRTLRAKLEIPYDESDIDLLKSFNSKTLVKTRLNTAFAFFCLLEEMGSPEKKKGF